LLFNKCRLIDNVGIITQKKCIVNSFLLEFLQLINELSCLTYQIFI